MTRIPFFGPLDIFSIVLVAAGLYAIFLGHNLAGGLLIIVGIIKQVSGR